MAYCVLTLLVLLICPTGLLAHNAGLSAADIRVHSQGLAVVLTFAGSDIERLTVLDEDLDGRVSKEEFGAAEPELEKVCLTALELRSGGRPLPAISSVASLHENQTVEVEIHYSSHLASRLTVRSLIPARIGHGHQQEVIVRNNAGVIISQHILRAEEDTLEVDLANLPPSTSRSSVMGQFILLGIEHILTGYDHLLFLIALLLAGGGMKGAIRIISSFTVAHSITLALATLNWVRIPPGVVEPLIAASIAYVGLENIFHRTLEYRWVLTFAFGLVHGFGFASALRDLGIGTGGTPIAIPLLSFNLGVELGQISIACLALPVLKKLRSSSFFLPRYVPACSLLVSLVGVFWFFQRVGFP